MAIAGGAPSSGIARGARRDTQLPEDGSGSCPAGLGVVLAADHKDGTAYEALKDLAGEMAVVTGELAERAGGSYRIFEEAGHLGSIKVAKGSVIRTALETFERWVRRHTAGLPSESTG